MSSAIINEAVMAQIRILERIVEWRFTKPAYAEEAISCAGSIYAIKYRDANLRIALIGDGILRQVLVLDGYSAGVVKGLIYSYCLDK